MEVPPRAGTGGLTWVSAAPEGDSADLTSWRGAVGPAVRLSPGGLTVAPPADQLAVVSWNVHVGGGDLIRLVTDLRSGELTGGTPVHDFVLLLQEAYRAGEQPLGPLSGSQAPRRIDAAPPRGPRLDVVEVARTLGLELLYVPSMGNGDGSSGAEDRGNAILSTRRLSNVTAIVLPFEGQRRVAVSGHVAGRTSSGSPWRLRVVSAHLDSRTRWSRILDSFGSARARQARALLDALPTDPTVLGADLNTWGPRFTENAPEVLGRRFQGVQRGPGGTFTLAGVVQRRLDYLVFDRAVTASTGMDGAAVVRVEDRYGSDHHPLVTILDLG